MPALKKHPYFPVIAAALPKHVVDYTNSDDVNKFINERYEACKNARTADAKASGKKRTQTSYNKAETDSMNRWYKKTGCERGIKYLKPILIAKYILAKDWFDSDGDKALENRDAWQIHEKIKFLQEPLPQSTSSSSTTTTTTKTASSSDSEASGSSDVNQR